MGKNLQPIKQTAGIIKMQPSGFNPVFHRAKAV
jgi:hypothetical protein